MAVIPAANRKINYDNYIQHSKLVCFLSSVLELCIQHEHSRHNGNSPPKQASVKICIQQEENTKLPK